MSRRKRKNKNRPKRRRGPPPVAQGWTDEEGLHALLPGAAPDQETLDRMTQAYQEQIRNSPMWDEMLRQFGPQKAEELLRQCRAELG